MKIPYLNYENRFSGSKVNKVISKSISDFGVSGGWGGAFLEEKNMLGHLEISQKTTSV